MFWMICLPAKPRVWLDQIACLAGDKTGLADSIEFWGRELDRGRFGCFSCQQIIFPASQSAAQYIY